MDIITRALVHRHTHQPKSIMDSDWACVMTSIESFILKAGLEKITWISIVAIPLISPRTNSSSVSCSEDTSTTRIIVDSYSESFIFDCMPIRKLYHRYLNTAETYRNFHSPTINYCRWNHDENIIPVVTEPVYNARYRF